MDPELAKLYSELMKEAEEGLLGARAMEGEGRGMEKAIAEAERLSKIASRPRTATGLPRELEAALFEARQVAGLAETASVTAEALVARLSEARAAARRAVEAIAAAMKPRVGDEVRTLQELSWEDYENTTWFAPQGVKGRIVWIAPDGEMEIRLDRPITAPSAAGPGKQSLDTLWATAKEFEVTRRGTVGGGAVVAETPGTLPPPSVGETSGGGALSEGTVTPVAEKAAPGPPKTIEEWSRVHPQFAAQVLQTPTGALSAPYASLTPQANADLYGLEDYVVWRRSEGSLWLVPRVQAGSVFEALTSQESNLLGRMECAGGSMRPSAGSVDERIAKDLVAKGWLLRSAERLYSIRVK